MDSGEQEVDIRSVLYYAKRIQSKLPHNEPFMGIILYL
jgi:hypothetical protein